jgi:predicted Rossmann fold flavoprotein
MNIFDTAVVGAGPAGLIAAGFSALSGSRTLIIEKNASAGKKLLITGGGRCNLTNRSGDIIDAFGRNGKFLYPALNAFSVKDTLDFFARLGVKCVTEEGCRVFPASGNSRDVLKALTDFVHNSGVRIYSGAKAKGIEIKDGCVRGVRLSTGTVKAAKVIVATGGLSYAVTGSDGDGFRWAEDAGHTIVPLRPVLTSVISSERWVSRLQGLTIPEARITAFAPKKTAEESGAVLFTSDGLTGPAVYNISRELSGRYDDFTLKLNMFPNNTAESLDLELADLFKNNDKKMLKTILAELVSPKLLPVIVMLSGIAEETQGARMSKEFRRRLVTLMSALEIRCSGFHGFKKATVTAGGVSLREIDSKTMASKLVKGLCFAGEILDLDGKTGGYNLQMCWSTGRLAGVC